MSFLSTFGLTGNNLDPNQKMQHAAMIKQQLEQWRQQENSQLAMQAPELLQALNSATLSLENDDALLGDLQQIHSLVASAPQEVQEELEERIKETIERQPKSQLNRMYNQPQHGYNPNQQFIGMRPSMQRPMAFGQQPVAFGQQPMAFGQQPTGYPQQSSFSFMGGRRRRRTRRRQRGGYSSNTSSYGSSSASVGGRRRKRKTHKKRRRSHRR